MRKTRLTAKKNRRTRRHKGGGGFSSAVKRASAINTFTAAAKSKFGQVKQSVQNVKTFLGNKTKKMLPSFKNNASHKQY